MLQNLEGSNSPKMTSPKLVNRSKALKVLLILSMVTFAMGVLPSAASASVKTKTDPLNVAIANMEKANKDAAAAASKYQAAYGELAKLNDQVKEVSGQLEVTETSLSSMKEKVTARAVSAYISSSDSSAKDEYKEIINKTRRTQLLDTVADVDDNQISQYVALKEDLGIRQQELASLQDNAKKTLNTLSEQKKELDAKLASATKAKKDLEAKIAADKKAAAKVVAAKAAAAKAEAAKKSGSSNIAGSGQIINPGNRTLVCPIAGGVTFTNDWGQPRSGGRSHKGTDLFSARGTPNVAITSGRLFFQNEGTGGISAYIQSDNGILYYYTHLQNTVGSPRNVVPGEVIGHTGSTGNAAGGATHTHFEIRPGGKAQNPYPTLRSIC
jgi:murein DD-endopeptidase MepM/ murein hydrolase activator NlpD